MIVIGNGSKSRNQIPAEKESLLIGEKVMIQNRWRINCSRYDGLVIEGCNESGEVANMKLNSVSEMDL